VKRTLAGLIVVTIVLLGGAGTAGAVNRDKVRRPGPIRVLLMGDSVTYFSQNRVQPLLGPKYQVITGAVAGQSLLDQNVCNGTWARSLVQLYDPDVIVVEYLGNYRNLQPFGVGSCVSTPYGSAKFYKKWETSARMQQRSLRVKGGRVIWAQMPTTNFPPYYNSLIFNAIYAKIAGKQATLLDAWTPFGGPIYNAAKHQTDGIHFNTPGNVLYASLVAGAAR
jgi:hypothetical protein